MKNFVAVILLAVICFVKADQLTVTDQAYFDITIDGEEKGRIEVALFGNDAPKTVKNFLAICKDGINGKTYAGSKFHRVIKKFMVQGGDIENGDGTGSISIYGKYFADEPNGLKHLGAGYLSMANAGKDTNGCQFFITTIATPWLDGHHTVFGKVSKNQGLVHTIEMSDTDSDDHPLKEVKISACGIIPTPEPFKLVDSPYDYRYKEASRLRMRGGLSNCHKSERLDSKIRDASEESNMNWEKYLAYGNGSKYPRFHLVGLLQF